MAHTGYGRMLLAGAAALGWLATTTGPAEAAFVFTVREQGPDVIVTGSGSLNLAALSFDGHVSFGAAIAPFAPALTAGRSDPADAYLVNPQPNEFGPGGLRSASSFSGDQVSIDDPIAGGAPALLGVPLGYVSGDPLANSMTFAGQTFASLGVKPGILAWRWGSGATADHLGVNIVPLPAPALLLGVGLLGLAALHRGRSKSETT